MKLGITILGIIIVALGVFFPYSMLNITLETYRYIGAAVIIIGIIVAVYGFLNRYK